MQWQRVGVVMLRQQVLRFNPDQRYGLCFLAMILLKLNLSVLTRFFGSGEKFVL